MFDKHFGFIPHILTRGGDFPVTYSWRLPILVSHDILRIVGNWHWYYYTNHWHVFISLCTLIQIDSTFSTSISLVSRAAPSTRLCTLPWRESPEGFQPLVCHGFKPVSNIYRTCSGMSDWRKLRGVRKHTSSSSSSVWPFVCGWNYSP